MGDDRPKDCNLGDRLDAVLYPSGGASGRRHPGGPDHPTTATHERQPHRQMSVARTSTTLVSSW